MTQSVAIKLIWTTNVWHAAVDLQGVCVQVVKRSKRERQASVASPTETSMERLIEKMMVDLDADSDDSSFTVRHHFLQVFSVISG
jgi:hypothetical protein